MRLLCNNNSLFHRIQCRKSDALKVVRVYDRIFLFGRTVSLDARWPRLIIQTLRNLFIGIYLDDRMGELQKLTANRRPHQTPALKRASERWEERCANDRRPDAYSVPPRHPADPGQW